MSQDVAVGGERPYPLPLVSVCRADGYLLQSVEDVELGDDETGETVDPHREACRDRVKPAAPARTTGSGAVLTTQRAEGVAHLACQLRREGAFADPRSVRLGNAYDALQSCGPYAASGCRRAGDTVAGGNIRIGAEVDIEEGALGPFEEYLFSPLHGPLQKEGGVGDILLQSFGVFDILVVDIVYLVSVLMEEVLNQVVLFQEVNLYLLTKDRLIE